ncbi:NUDIX hydrolase [Jiella endophytica]|uniref:NUDIX hydrolase n=1 Tax=Jiella endophytica TaxID=2558362 RepID=A0A4Y8RTC6_9HYPH|nr:NUDIX hydrolase [Jiella endophytica]TFF27486.1 NUDIX hydrolase [Jiella endophytica]
MTGESRLAALEAERRRLSGEALPAAGGDVAIRDAATLIIVDETAEAGGPRFLMGLRGKAHVFMANRFVFPGGRVDPADRELAARFSLPGDAGARLCAAVPDGFTARDAAALALAAIRETFEETGLLIGSQAADSAAFPKDFAAFSERGLAPAVDWLVPIARAVTPEGPPRRFDTRFFVINATRLGAISENFDPPTDEFERIGWVSTGSLDDHSLAPITRTILGDLAERMAEGSWLDASVAMPYYRTVDGRIRKDLI